MRIEIGLVKRFALALAMVVTAGNALAAKVDPFVFSGSSATQQEYWDYLMRFKMYGAEGIEFAGRNIKVPDSSGWFGTSKGDFTLKNGTHVVGGPILIGGSVAFSSGDGDEHFTSGPVRIDGDVSTDNWNAGSVINGVSCIRGNVSSKYNDEVAYANRFHGTRYTSCPDSIPNFLDGLSIPSVGSISGATTLSAINADNRVVEIVVPEGEGMYDIRIPSIRLSNESSLFVKMPTGGRLTRIFVSDGLSISAQSIIQVQYKNENGDGYTTIANSDYAGNLLFYVMDDFTWDARENDRYLQGSFISTGTITIKQQLTLAGQLLARKLIIDANFDGTGFNFVPFDPNKLNIVGSTGGHFKESDTWMEVPIALDSAAKVDVTFKYCFQFAPSWYPGTDAASVDDFNTDSGHKFPVCKMLDDAAGIVDTINTPYEVVKIPQGKESPTSDTRIWVNPKVDYLEEDAFESFRLQVFDLVGAVSPSNTRKASYELYVDDAEMEPKSADGSVNAVEDSIFTLTPSLFVYESKYNAQQGVVITSLPSRGTLTVGGKVLKSSDIPEGGLVVTLDTLRDDEDNITDIVFHDAIVYQGAKDGCNLAKSKFCVDADSYTSFKFKVIDVKDHMSKEDYTMTVTVAPRNDAPSVDNPTVTFKEGSTAGTTGSTKITVKDVDDNTFTYSFDDAHANYEKVSALYQINATTGVISVKNGVTLDYETADSVLTIAVKVTDAAVTTAGVGKKTVKSTVTLKILDVNEPPVIPDDGKDHYDVDEHSKKGFEVTRILFTDEDNADAKVTDFVAILTDNKKVSGKVSAEDLFALSIDKDANGDFYIVVSVKDSAKLNYEDLASKAKELVSYDVTISLKDQAGAAGCNTASINRKLNVNDINEVPTTEDASFNPKENIASGSTIGTVTASDLDTKNPDYGTLYFTIRDEVPFTINNSGVIKVAEGAELNYEKQPVYEFDVEVTDKVADPVISHVTITLENVNEIPEIVCLENDKNCEGPFSIAENSATGTVIHSFGVVDEDKDSKFALSSVVLSDTNKTGADTLFGVKFNSDKSQISIYVLNKSRLDYEKVNASYTVKIKVSDAAGAADSITRVINVIDVNEAPTAKPFSKEIAENLPTGTVVGTVEASDPDIKNKTYSKLTYSIPVNEDASGANDVPFTINATTGEISVKDSSKLDYETNPSFTFKVEVKDIEYTATSTVTITLSDEEEPPEIIPDPECDEDKEDCCDPNLTSCDDPTPPDTNCVTNCGYKTGDTLYVNVRENSKTGTQILKYYVKDQDAGDLVSMKVYFEDVYKSGADSLFVVSPTLTKDTKGNYYFTLTVKDGSKLDFEKVNETHVLRVIVDDDGGKSDTIVRVIKVVDLNEKPTIEDVTKNIKENLPNDYPVDTLKASDPDIKNKEFSTLTYKILDAEKVPFYLDAKNPTIVKVKDRSKLNYETTPTFTFYVQVSDGTLSDTAKIVLKLTDEEEPPEIIPHDPECEEDDEECNKCDINFADCGKPVDPPDPTCTENCGYKGKNDTVYVNVRENTKTGTPILSYYVKDEDAGDLASMEVFFNDDNKSGADALFSITPKLVKDAKGYKFTVSVKDGSKLDYEKINESHRIVITVKDDAGLTDTIIRVIKVVDVNEPLTVKNANFNVDENSANGTVVGKMSASDQDTKHPEIFAVLKYSIIEEGTPFKMDSNKVRVADGSRLNYEKDSLYTIHVRVTDGEFSDTALVKIKLNNTNEEPFIKCLEDDTNCDGPYDVEENTPTNTVIHTFAVMDDDKDPAFRLNSATIIDTKGTGAEKLFGIKFNKDSSQVTVFVKDGSLLDYEKIYPSYTVKIKIKDAMQVADSIIRVINVIDVDEAPTLKDAKFTIAENTPNGTILGSLLATDPDSKNVLFRTLSYEILDDVPFKMDSNKVVVSDVSRLNYEKVTEFYFDVRVTDGGGLSAVATVYVKLTDVEEPPEIIPEPECDPTKEVCHECDATIEDCDNKEKIPDPTCTENCGYLKNDTLYVNVRENSATGSKILEYYVKDEDAGDLQSMEVSFKDLNKSGSDSLFSITPALVKDSKGYKFILTVADSEKLDYEKVNHVHKILITVKDDAGLTDTVVRVINVVDVNEPPYIVKAEFDLDEHKPAGFVVGTIEWGDDKDKDGVSNPAFRDNRVVAVGGATEIFDVDSMGVITVKKRLNYETDDTTYTLQVSVEDKNDPSLSSTEVMTIHLKNIKETPIITSTEFTIPENPSDKDVVGTLTSEDPDDLDDKEKRTYTLIGTSPYVKVSEDGKIIVTNKEMFDFEKVESFTIKVKVTDPQNVSSDTVVTIKITDENEAPTLDDKVIKVSEDSKPNVVIDTLKAKDPDSKNKDFRDLTYTIVSGDTSLFEVDPKTGEVILKDSLDYEKKKEYILKVEVSDGEFADTAKVTVAVQNVIERSEVVIEKVQDADSLWVRPDSVFTNHPNMTICWTEDGDEICTDTTMTEGIHTIIKKFQDPKKDFAGADTVVIHISTSAPKVIISADGSDRGYGDIFNIDEVVDEKDTSIYVNNPKNDIRVTIKDPVKKDSSFVVKLDLETVNVSKKDLETVSTVVDKGNFKLDEKPENAVRTPVNGSEIKVAYTEKVNGKEVQITYYTDNDSNVILTPVINEKGEIDSVEVITVSYVTKIGGREVTVSYQADGVTGQVLNVGADGTLTYDDKIVVPSTPVGKPSSSSSSDKDSSKTATTELSVGSYKVTYEYEDDNHNTVVVTYTIDEKGNIVKNAEGDIGYTVSYTYENKFGNAATQSVFIVLDQSKPVVEILYPTPMQVIRSNSVEVKWTINGVLQDTLTVQGLSKGYNSITRTYHDKAGNMDSVTIGVFMKDGKDVDLSVEVPVVQMDREKVEEYYASNPPKKGQTASVSLKNPDSENEVEALTIGSYGQKDGSFKSPYPGVSGDSHLGPTVVMDIRLPTVSDVGGLATFDDIVLKDGTISSRGIDADGCYARDEFMSMTGLSEKELIERDSCVKYTVEEYVEKFCDPDEEIDVTGDLSKINLYNTKMHTKVWIYTSLGGFVDYYSFKIDLNDPEYTNKAGLLQMYFEQKPDRDGEIHTDDGRILATGAYLYKVESDIKAKLRCSIPPFNVKKGSPKKYTDPAIKKSEEMLKPFGYRRPTSK